MIEEEEQVQRKGNETRRTGNQAEEPERQNKRKPEQTRMNTNNRNQGKDQW